jgi:hypothetical protein
MRFNQYLAELASVEDGQAIEAHEPTGEASSSVDNPRVRMEVNVLLANGLNDTFVSPEAGIQAIRKVLHRFGFDLPALYDADPEGDEVVIELDQFGVSSDEYQYSIYILYYLTDEGSYEFFAELGDDNRMEELISDEGDEEED